MAVKQKLKKLYFKFSRLTGRFRKLPEFIIIGVQKGGTSSLFYYLKQHPDIYFPHLKELHFFDLNYKKGINWYKAFFPIFSNKRIGECTPYYIFHPQVPKRIKKDLKNTKFIVVMREPVSRAYSQYKKEKTEGHDTIESFEAAFNTEEQRTANETQKLMKDENYYSFAHQRFTYFSRGLYYKQIEYWLQYFNLNQFLFIKSESLFNDPKQELSKVYKFLDVKEVFPKSFSVINAGKEFQQKEEMKPEYYEYFKDDMSKLKTLAGDEISWNKYYK